MTYIILATKGILTPNTDLSIYDKTRGTSYSIYQPTLGLQKLQRAHNNLMNLL